MTYNILCLWPCAVDGLVAIIILVNRSLAASVSAFALFGLAELHATPPEKVTMLVDAEFPVPAAVVESVQPVKAGTEVVVKSVHGDKLKVAHGLGEAMVDASDTDFAKREQTARADEKVTAWFSEVIRSYTSILLRPVASSSDAVLAEKDCDSIDAKVMGFQPPESASQFGIASVKLLKAIHPNLVLDLKGCTWGKAFDGNTSQVDLADKAMAYFEASAKGFETLGDLTSVVAESDSAPALKLFRDLILKTRTTTFQMFSLLKKAKAEKLDSGSEEVEARYEKLSQEIEAINERLNSPSPQ